MYSSALARNNRLSCTVMHYNNGAGKFIMDKKDTTSKMIYVIPPEQAVFCTTGQFKNLDKGYVRHCGPTAITNLLLTLKNLEEGPEVGDITRETQEAVFRNVAGYGRRHLLYINRKILKYWGGTSDIMAGIYIRKMLDRSGFDTYRVFHRRLFTFMRAKRALQRGSVLFIELRHHKKYGNHDVLCYGAGKHNGENVLYIADGWSDQPVMMPVKDMCYGFIIEIADKRMD